MESIVVDAVTLLLENAPTVAILLVVWWRVEKRNEQVESFLRSELSSCIDTLTNCIGIEITPEKPKR